MQTYDMIDVILSTTTNFTAGTLCGSGICLVDGGAATADTPMTVLCPAVAGAK